MRASFVFFIVFFVESARAELPAKVERVTKIKLEQAIEGPTAIAIERISKKGIIGLHVLTSRRGEHWVVPVLFAPPEAKVELPTTMNVKTPLCGLAGNIADESLWAGLCAEPKSVKVSKVGAAAPGAAFPGGAGVRSMSASPASKVFALLSGESADGSQGFLGSFEPGAAQGTVTPYSAENAAVAAHVIALGKFRALVAEVSDGSPPALYLVKAGDPARPLEKTFAFSLADAGWNAEQDLAGAVHLPQSRTLLVLPRDRSTRIAEELWMITLSESLAEPSSARYWRAVIAGLSVLLALAVVAWLFLVRRA